jgi:RimJ/RimL family protein N-acetyltransferase
MIRRLDASDAAAYRRIRLDALRWHPEAFGSSYEEEAEYALDDFRRHLAPPGCVFGVGAGDRLVGIAGLYVQTRRKHRHKGTVVGVYVEAGHRRGGTAQRLVEAVIEQARQQELRLLQLTVTVGNDSARRLYSRLGFQSFGIERRALLVEGVFYDEELMVLDLA